MSTTFHPLAEIFPMMIEAELAGLVADIKEHGLRDPIITLDGQILDGRNRYRACIEAGVEPRFEEWNGEGSPQAFVISHNLHRRHLSESQRAMVAARIATRTQQEAAREAINARYGHVSGIPETKIPTVSEAAQLLNINKDSVTDARRVLSEGTPEEIAAVDHGEIAVTTLAKQIRNKTPPAERHSKAFDPNANRLQTQRANAKIWELFRDAITNLTSLPRPADVVRIVRYIDRTKLTDTKLLAATEWLTEFSDAWTSPNADAEADSRRKGKPAGETEETIAA